MTSEESKKAVVAAWQTFASRDPKQIGECFTEDAEWLAPKDNATAVALNGSHHMIGRAAIADFLATGFRKLFAQDVRIDFRGVHADGDRVIVEERMQAVLANGRAYDNDYCFIFELKDGLIHRVREYMDTLRGQKMIFG
jgi:uncharacterized protein